MAQAMISVETPSVRKWRASVKNRRLLNRPHEIDPWIVDVDWLFDVFFPYYALTVPRHARKSRRKRRHVAVRAFYERFPPVDKFDNWERTVMDHLMVRYPLDFAQMQSTYESMDDRMDRIMWLHQHMGSYKGF